MVGDAGRLSDAGGLSDAGDRPEGGSAGRPATPAEREPTLTELVERFGPAALARSHKHHDVRVTVGTGAERYVVFEPANPRPDTAPLIFFHHGWDGTNPKYYGAWIDHLVRRGSIVVFPIYQRANSDPPALVTKVALAADQAALRLLGTADHVRPDLERVGAVGYSMGASISVNLAALPEPRPLPRLRALLLANPGDGFHVARGKDAVSILGDLSTLQKDTRAIVLVGDDDPIAKRTGPEIYGKLCGLPADQRRMLRMHTDRHGADVARADHLAPSAFRASYDFGLTASGSTLMSSREPNAQAAGATIGPVDMYGYWRLADAVFDETFFQTNADAVFGAGLAATFMGVWPDGVAVAPLTSDDRPCQREAGAP
jgi:acetyl esterase/lipase